MSATPTPPTTTTTRPLGADDLDAVVAIDRKLTGRARRGFFAKRLAAALERPKDFIYIGALRGDDLVGYALARVSEGAFGAAVPIAQLDAIGVDPDGQGAGVGRALTAELDAVMKRKGVAELRSQVDWTNRALSGFFAGQGFAVAPRIVLERGTGELTTTGPESSDPDDPLDDDARSPARDRVPVRSMAAADLPDLVRIDRLNTGRDRGAYLERKLAEALEESGVRVSLVVELDGRPAGFVMARVDFGEFGQAEPEAVIDTIDVDPARVHAQVAEALVSQLFANLAGLRVERVRTEVAWNHFALLGFLDHCGFRPSQRLAFTREVG